MKINGSKMFLMKNKWIIVFIVGILGVTIIGTWLWATFHPAEETDPTSYDPKYDSYYGFRAKQVSLEEASRLIGARVPTPTYLPESYSHQYTYIGVGNETLILLISNEVIDTITRDPPDQRKDYPINLVDGKLYLYASYEQDLGIVGGKRKPTPREMILEETKDGYIIFQTTQIDGRFVSLMLNVAEKTIDEEELVKIMQSIK